jgi:two-component system phosphate regulon sensor histidine kinase PhoR
MGTGLILEAIAEEMQSGVIAIDQKGVVEYANPFFIRLFSITEATVGRRAEDVLSGTGLLRTIEGFRQRGVKSSEDVEISEGGKFFGARLVPLSEGRRTSLLVFLKDITEEKRVEAIKRDFVANVSHELRTPLASIKGYAETLLDGGMADKETLRDFLRIIDRHATRMSRLIDDLLTLSRLESHEFAFSLSPVDVKDLIQSTIAGFDKQARDKGIRLSLDLPERLPKALGDRDRLEQVMTNLLDNAIKYTPSGGRVDVSAGKGDGLISISVKDTGIGIPKGDTLRIFERFYRVDKARSRELGGTGLGLAIVKHILQGHNTRVSVESEQGKGSVFSFRLKSI